MIVVLKLSFHELVSFTGIVAATAKTLGSSKDDLTRLALLTLIDLRRRMEAKTEFSFYGNKNIRLNIKECLALRHVLKLLAPQEGIYESTIRNKVYITIDKQIN